MSEIAIVGYGGFARELYVQMLDVGYKKNQINFFVDDEYLNERTRPISLLKENLFKYEVLVAIADPLVRKRIVESELSSARFLTFIHDSVKIFDENISVGVGSILCADCVLTTNISLGRHVQLNPKTCIGHDSSLGDYCTTAYSVTVAGNVAVGDCVYFGSNSACKEKITICDDVVIGLGACVVKSIDRPGIYVGAPAKSLGG